MTTPTQAAEARRAEIADVELTTEQLRELGYRIIARDEANRGDVAFLLGAILLRDSELSRLTAALAARPTPSAVPEGYVLVPVEEIETLTEAVGCVLTWAHKVEGVAVIRRDHFDGLSPANAAVICALAARPTPADSGEGK